MGRRDLGLCVVVEVVVIVVVFNIWLILDLFTVVAVESVVVVADCRDGNDAALALLMSLFPIVDENCVMEVDECADVSMMTPPPKLSPIISSLLDR